MAIIMDVGLACPVVFDYKDVNGSLKAEQDWMASLGDILHFGQGDGYAYYLVVKRRPLTLQWISIGDDWSLPDWQLRGLTLEDVDHMLASDKAIRELFSSP